MSPTQIPFPGSFSLGPALKVPAGLAVGFPLFTSALFDAQASISETGAEPDEALPVAIFSKNPQEGQTGQPKQEQPQLWSTDLPDFQMRVEVSTPEESAVIPEDVIEVSEEAVPSFELEAETAPPAIALPAPAMTPPAPMSAPAAPKPEAELAPEAAPAQEGVAPAARARAAAPALVLRAARKPGFVEVETPQGPVAPATSVLVAAAAPALTSRDAKRPELAKAETAQPSVVPATSLPVAPAAPVTPASAALAVPPKTEAPPQRKQEAEAAPAMWTPSLAAESAAPLRTATIVASVPGEERQVETDEPAPARETVKDAPPTMAEAVAAATRGIAPVRTVLDDAPARAIVLPAVAGRVAPGRAPLAVAVKVKSAAAPVIVVEAQSGSAAAAGLEARPTREAPKVSVIKAIQPVEVETAPKKIEPLKEISIRIGEKQEVQLRVVERGGELHVAVRTANSNITQDLRDELPELVRHIEQHGYRTEAWRPAGVVSGVAAAAEAGTTEFRQGHPDPQQQQKQQGWSQQHSNQQQQNQANRPKWVEELENGLTREEQPLTGESNGFKR